MAEGKSLEQHVREVNKVVKHLDLDPLKFTIDDIVDSKIKYNKKFDKKMDAIGKETNKMMSIRATDPIQGFSEIAQFAGSSLAAAGDKIGDYSKFFGKKLAVVGKGIGKTSEFAGKGIAGMAGFTGAVAPLIIGQEKNLRAMIDYGLHFSDGLDGATRLRSSTSAMGLNITEMLKAQDQSRAFLVNTNDNLGNSTVAFNNFVAKLAENSRNDAGFNQFGYGAQEFLRGMSQNAKMLYDLGEMQELGLPEKRKLAQLFQTTQAVTLGLSNLTGVSREQLINAGLEAQGREDITMNLLRNKEELEAKYGDGATTQIQLNADYLNGMFATFFPHVSKEVGDSMKAFVARATVTDNFQQVLPQSISEILAIGGSDLSNEFITMMQQGLTGQIDREEITKRFRDLVKTASDLPAAPAVGDPVLDSFNTFINTAATMPKSFTDASNTTIEGQIKDASSKADQADDSIEAIESARVVFKNIQDAVLPGYGSLAGAFATTTEGLRSLKKVFEDIGLIDKPEETSVTEKIANEKKLTLSRQDKSFIPDAKREGGYGGTFDPHTGHVIRDTGTGVAGESGLTVTGPTVSPGITPPSAKDDFKLAEEKQLNDTDRIKYGNQGKIRGGPLDQALEKVLTDAAIVTNPLAQILVTSGGQMDLNDWNNASGNKSHNKSTDTYYLNGKAVRTGSRRHDGGKAADVQLLVDGKAQNINSDMFLKFTEAAFALGIRAGSADHGYMGSHTAHMDIVGTDYGGTTIWAGKGTAFATAMQRGQMLNARPEANVYAKKLEELNNTTPVVAPIAENITDSKTVELDGTIKSNQTDSSSSVPTNSVVPNGLSERQEEIRASIAAEQERINRSESGVNEYFGRETKGRENSREEISELEKELAEIVKITKQYNQDAVVQGTE